MHFSLPVVDSKHCFTCRINIEARKSPKMSRAAQEISRSPRLPIRKPSIGSPSLTRREFPLEDITQVLCTLLPYPSQMHFFPEAAGCDRDPITTNKSVH